MVPSGTGDGSGVAFGELVGAVEVRFGSSRFFAFGFDCGLGSSAFAVVVTCWTGALAVRSGFGTAMRGGASASAGGEPPPRPGSVPV